MNKFQNNVCPLCGTVLQLRRVCGVSVFSCPGQQVEWCSNNGNIISRSHYEVEYDKTQSVQRMYILPYSVDNFQNSFKSRIYKLRSSGNAVTGDKWELVVETSRIHADTSEKLLERIQKLVTFL